MLLKCYYQSRKNVKALFTIFLTVSYLLVICFESHISFHPAAFSFKKMLFVVQLQFVSSLGWCVHI